MSVDDDTTLLITRIFDAPREQVFDAWLTREEWQAWIGPEGVRCDVPLLEAHVGGRSASTCTCPTARCARVWILQGHRSAEVAELQLGS